MDGMMHWTIFNKWRIETLHLLQLSYLKEEERRSMDQ